MIMRKRFDMSLQNTPRSNRVHIALFGRRNAGKSSVINALTGQEIAIVSEVKGTTTDPVYKAMEILPLGPVVIIDTAGLDDFGDLGELRRKKSLEVLNKADIALLVIDGPTGLTDEDREILSLIEKKKIPGLIVVNKIDLEEKEADVDAPFEVLRVSAKTGVGIDSLKLALTRAQPEETMDHPIVADLLAPGDVVVLVTPIDSAAPKGRLILPQQQTVRDILEADAISIVTKETELKATLAALAKPPKMVITDSQAFGRVSAETPEEIPLTSFSILFARHKGDLEALVRGVKAVESLEDGDRVLISEGCTHHRQADDIGTVKIPRWLKEHTGKELILEHTAGIQFDEHLDPYSLVIHCGGCMLNNRAMQYRIETSEFHGVPIVNYGVFIADVHGILERALAPFPEALAIYRG